MEALSGIAHGFYIALQPANIMWCFVGCFFGTIIGILPGLGPAATIALLLPLTFNMDPTGGIIMLAGIYYGAKYGGSTTSILLNMPGEASSVVSCIDGVALAGAYGASGNMFDIGLLIGFGLLGFLMAKFGFPSAPLVLGFVLGDAMERALRQSMAMSEGDPTI